MAERELSELGLLGVFLAVAVGFIGLTTTFRSSSAQLFPRLTGTVIVVGIGLLLLEKRLPEPVRRIVAESVDIVDRDEFGMNGEDGGDDSDTAITGIDAGETTTKPDRRDLPPVLDRLTARQFTFGAIAGYVGVAYVLSILVATPLFVLTYGYWNRQPRWAVIGLTVVSIGICLLFMSIANAPLDRSLLFPRGMF